LAVIYSECFGMRFIILSAIGYLISEVTVLTFDITFFSAILVLALGLAKRNFLETDRKTKICQHKIDTNIKTVYVPVNELNVIISGIGCYKTLNFFYTYINNKIYTKFN